jgi:hypothetical protein
MSAEAALADPPSAPAPNALSAPLRTNLFSKSGHCRVHALRADLQMAPASPGESPLEINAANFRLALFTGESAVQFTFSSCMLERE